MNNKTDNELPSKTPSKDGKSKFDPRALALPQNFAGLGAVKKETLVVPIKKPNKQQWICPHRDHSARIEVAAIELKDEGEFYIVDPSLHRELSRECIAVVLVPYQTKQGAIAYWPIRLPDPDGKHNSWHASALEIANSYGDKWIRVSSNKEINGYDVITPIAVIPPPIWPSDMDALLARASKGQVIDSVDHCIVKKLRGEE